MCVRASIDRHKRISVAVVAAAAYWPVGVSVEIRLDKQSVAFLLSHWLADVEVKREREFGRRRWRTELLTLCAEEMEYSIDLEEEREKRPEQLDNLHTIHSRFWGAETLSRDASERV